MTRNCPDCALVFTLLLGFGIGYNALVAYLEKRGHDRGYMGFIVALGCGVTLFGAGFLVGWEAVAWVTGCFAASGIPMIVGSAARHVRARARARRELLERNGRVVEGVGDGQAPARDRGRVQVEAGDDAGAGGE